VAVHQSLILGKNPRGTIGKQITFASWKGIGVAKVRPIPSNPKTSAQTTQRNNFKALVTEWHHEDRTATDKEAWDLRASRQSRPMSGFNLFMSLYRSAFYNGKTLDFFRGCTVSLSGTTVSYSGKGSYDGDITINVYTKSGALIKSESDTVSGGTFSGTVTVPSGTTEVFVIFKYDVTNHFGESGTYYDKA